MIAAKAESTLFGLDTLEASLLQAIRRGGG